MVLDHGNKKATSPYALDLYYFFKRAGLFLHGLLMGYLGIEGWGTALTSKVDQEAQPHSAIAAAE